MIEGQRWWRSPLYPHLRRTWWWLEGWNDMVKTGAVGLGGAIEVANSE